MSEAIRQKKTSDTPRSKVAQILGSTVETNALSASQAHSHVLPGIADAGAGLHLGLHDLHELVHFEALSAGALGVGFASYGLPLMSQLPRVIEDAQNANFVGLALDTAQFVADASGLTMPGLVVEALRFQIDGLMAICHAHEAGDQDAAAMTYANAWSDVVLSGAMPEHVIPQLADARKRGVHDAIATMQAWGDQALTIRDKLHAELGGGARRALIVEMYTRAGLSGIA